MKINRLSLFFHNLQDSFLAMLLVMATSVPLFLIGRSTLGEGVIALVYLLPITWSAYRWGQSAGVSAAITAALAFNFLFIPPFFTFVVGRLESWLLLAIFLAVAIILVEWIQGSLTRAREAVQMYEMASAVANQVVSDGVGYALARQIRQVFQAALVSVVYHVEKDSPAIAFCAPVDVEMTGRPDRIIPIYNARGLIGEIQIWAGSTIKLPTEEGRLLQNFAQQAGRAFERTYLSEHETPVNRVLRETQSK
jgi:K+-sensing histidine kinase KdpD